MTPLQKFSVFVLVVMGLAAVAAGTLFGVSGDPATACAGFSLMALLVFGRRILRNRDGPALDERDVSIGRTAQLVSYGVFWLVFVGAFTAAPFLLGFERSVSLRMLVLTPFVGAWILLVARSIATLLLYARGG
jgi:hypothetical protein